MRSRLSLGLLLYSVVFFLAGCAAFGVRESNDPMVKLDQAHYLEYQESRPLAADKMIHQAKAICEERKDDKCLGMVFKSYGRFLNSPGFDNERWAAPYIKGAGKFLDPTVTLGNRRQKAIEYETRARELLLKSKDYTEVVNVDNDIAVTYRHLNDSAQACWWYNRALEDYPAMIAADPNVPMHLPKEFPTYQDYVTSLKKSLGCSN